ncbi:MAG: hypothetical protein Kow00104_00330 [Rhodothalassiaceae bacterium]
MRASAAMPWRGPSWLLLALALFLEMTSAQAQSEAEALRAAFDHLVAETARLETDLKVFEASLPARFECPPDTPNKESAYDRLEEFQARRARLRGEARAIDDRRILLGRAGEGQFLAGLIIDAEVDEVRHRIDALAQAIAQKRGLVDQRPATARDCDPEADPIRAINYAPPSLKPGEIVRADVTAVSESGKAIIITDARLSGVEAVGTLQAIAGLGTQTVTITFRIADVKSRGPYGLGLAISGRPAGMAAAGASNGRLNLSYEVANAAPEIVSIPSAPTADPGGNLGLSGEVTVIDRNADDRNPHELWTGSLAFAGHPAGLETTPGEAFRSFSSVALQSHDPATGTYVFKVARPANARLPHKHGLFPAEIVVTDARGGTASQPFDITVRNVAPTGRIALRPGQFYHSGDGQSVAVVGAVSDDNGHDDIVEIEIEASDAGGRRYRLSENSIVATPRDDRSVGITLDDRAFPHTDREGRHDIPAFAQDGGAPEQGETAPKIGKFESWITIGNEEPQANAYGFIRGFAGPMSDKRGLCPRELFRVAFNARDAEEDRLKVTATMAGGSVEMHIMPGETTYTALMTAPDAPGIYPITLEAIETDTARKKSVRKVIELEVVGCSPTEKTESGVASGGGEIVIDAGKPGLLVKLVPADPPLPGEPATQATPPSLEHEGREGTCTIGADLGFLLDGLKTGGWYDTDGDPAEAVSGADGTATIRFLDDAALIDMREEIVGFFFEGLLHRDADFRAYLTHGIGGDPDLMTPAIMADVLRLYAKQKGLTPSSLARAWGMGMGIDGNVLSDILSGLGDDTTPADAGQQGPQRPQLESTGLEQGKLGKGLSGALGEGLEPGGRLWRIFIDDLIPGEYENGQASPLGRNGNTDTIADATGDRFNEDLIEDADSRNGGADNAIRDYEAATQPDAKPTVEDSVGNQLLWLALNEPAALKKLSPEVQAAAAVLLLSSGVAIDPAVQPVPPAPPALPSADESDAPAGADLNPLGLDPEYVKKLPPYMQLEIAAAILMHDDRGVKSDPCRIKKAAPASAPQSAASFLGGAAAELVGSNPHPVTVAIVDSGLDWNHPGLPHDRLWHNPGEVAMNGIDDDGNGLVDDIIGWNFANGSNRPWDHDGHGTFIAGAIGGVGVGINPHVRLMIVKALNDFGRTRASYIARGIAYAVHMGASIVNVSAGGEGLTAIEKAALDYAAANNVLVIVAAGNEGVELKDQALIGHPSVLVVAATGPDGKRAPFSNWGPAVSLAAPGVDVLSLRAHRTDTIRSADPSYVPGSAYVGEDRRYYRASGTSFAAPIVTGIASLLLSKDPSLTAADLKRILTQSARDIEEPGIDNLSGYGLVDARAALAIDREYFIEAAIAGVAVVPSGKDFAIEVRGTADADHLKSARLEIGAGEAPARFQSVGEIAKTAIRGGAIGLIPRKAVPKGVSTIRLVVTHANGREREARYRLTVD